MNPSINRPNIVVIMTDQQRADLCAREGFPLDTTPFLDTLAAQGVWFDKAYTTMPACAPARVSLLTGRYPSATRMRTNHNIPDATYTEDLFDVFRAGGYAVGLCGKNHTYLTPEKADFWFRGDHLSAEQRSEEEKAFDDFLGGLQFHWHPDATPFPVESQIPHRLVTAASDWLAGRQEDTRPFLLWLSFPEPHNPYQAPEPYFSQFPPESVPPPVADADTLADRAYVWQFCREKFEQAFPGFAEQVPRIRAIYCAMLRLIDDQVKRFVTFLEAQGLAENTLIVFLSDHGDFVGEYGLIRKGPELPEALTRIPLLFHGPGIHPGDGPHPAHVSLADLFPTLCEAAGLPSPAGVQGRSLWPLLMGEPYPTAEFASVYAEHGFGGLPYEETDTALLDPVEDGFTAAVLGPDGTDLRQGGYDCLNSRTQSGTLRMVRKGDWKLVMDATGRGQLYHLPTDPVELHNRWNDPDAAPVRAELTEELLLWCLRTADPLPLPRRRYRMKTHPRNYRNADRPDD
jgi:arylsulfatase A-like enzyme